MFLAEYVNCKHGYCFLMYNVHNTQLNNYEKGIINTDHKHFCKKKKYVVLDTFSLH